MNTKKNVFFVGLLGTLFLIIGFSLGSDSCSLNNLCTKIYDFINSDFINSDFFATLIFLTIPLFILSLITYKMRDEVFRAWWNFARWWVLVIIAVTLFLQNAGGGGWGISSGGFDTFILSVLYT